MIRYAAGYLVLINVIAFAVYGLDKWQARRQGRRVAEIHLLGLAAAGGSVGAWCGRRAFRHKTRKRSFRFAFWAIVAGQCAAVGWWWWWQPAG